MPIPTKADLDRLREQKERESDYDKVREEQEKIRKRIDEGTYIISRDDDEIVRPTSSGTIGVDFSPPESGV